MTNNFMRRSSLCLVGILGVLLFFSGTPVAAQVAPQFSHAPGFYSSAFDLELFSTTPGTVIRYTLDGSVPDENSPIFDGKIHIEDGNGRPAEISLIPTAWAPFWFAPPSTAIFRATVVRARTFTEDTASPVSSGTFFVDETGRRFSLPVISLTTDADNFFDYDIGIYVPGRIHEENFDPDLFYGRRPANYNQRGDEWERPVHFEFFEADGGLAVRQDLGVRTHGGVTRAHHMKALRLYARSDYGPSTLSHPFFGEDGTREHKRLLLRASGQDLFQTMLRDAYVHSVVGHLNIESQAYRPALVFLNGEYWGIHNIRERHDDHYLSLKYDLPREDIVVLSTDAVIDTGTDADSLSWVSFRQFVRSSDVSDPAVRAVIEETIDVDSHIDYHVAQIFICNIDWPGNNVRFWRNRGGDRSTPGPGDGRWRWMIFDTDISTANEPLTQAGCTHLTEAARYSDIFPRLLEAAWYRDAFLNRFADHFNSTFRAVRTVPLLDSLQAAIALEMPDHITRWRVPSDVPEWQAYVNEIRQFMRQRPPILAQQLIDQFDLDGIVPLDVDVSDPRMGYVKMNHLVVDSRLHGLYDASQPYPWTPWYFTGVPLTVTARANPGYRFVRWEGAAAGDSATVSITLREASSLLAVFEEAVVDPMRPAAHAIADGPYVFDHWADDEPEGSFPSSMVFQQSEINDPGLDDEMTGPYQIPEDEYAEVDGATIGFPYNNTARTRINGLGAEGLSMINTGRGRDLGAVVLAVNTVDVDHATVTWTGGTILPNSRVYAIRLQYRVGDEGDFLDVIHGGEPAEYARREQAGHSEVIGPIWLPADAMGQPYVQLRWKYYYTGERVDAASGQRDMLRIDDIVVAAAEAPAGAVALEFNQLHPTAQVGQALLPFEVSARRADGTVDQDFAGTVTLSMAAGNGVVRGSTRRTLTRGIARFDDIVIDGPTGSARLRATSASISEAVSQPLSLVSITERIMPRYIQGDQPENLDRVPFAYRLQIDGLLPDREYRYGNRVVSTSDPADQNGAGNAFYPLEHGGYVRSTDTPRFTDDDLHIRHGTFKTDSKGQYAGWFVTEPTGNARFTPGEFVYMRLLLNDGDDGDAFHHYLTTVTPVRVTSFGEEANEGSAVVGSGPAMGGHIAVIYDAEYGGSVIAAVPVEPSGMSVDNRFAQFYVDEVVGKPGRFGALVPNHLPHGFRRIEYRRVSDGVIVRSDVSEDGRWGETDTVDPRTGLSEISTIEIGAPHGPVLLQPRQDSSEVVRDPVLVWTALDGQAYDVEIATDDRFATSLSRFNAVADTTLAPGSLGADLRHFWRVRGTQPMTAWSAVHSFTTGQATNIAPPVATEPLAVWNYPNPVSGQTTIAFSLDAPATSRLEVFDMLGRSIRVLVDEWRPAGRHEVTFDGQRLPSGVYIYRLIANGRQETGTMLVVR